MASQFAEVTIKEILQIIKQAVSKIHKEGETGEKLFLFTNAN